MCTGVCHYSGWVHVTEDLICVGFFLFYFSCILIAHAFDGGKQTRSMVADFGTFCSPSLLERNIKQDKGLKRPESISCMRISACPLIIHTNDFLFKNRPKRQRAKKKHQSKSESEKRPSTNWITLLIFFFNLFSPFSSANIHTYSKQLSAHWIKK